MVEKQKVVIIKDRGKKSEGRNKTYKEILYTSDFWLLISDLYNSTYSDNL